MSISKNTTIKQIAELANVSSATASRVINQPESVKYETRSRVLEAMKELNYQSKQSQSRSILATFPTFKNPFYGLCIQGMQAAAKKREYQLLLQQIDNPQNKESYDFLLDSSAFQGVIFTHPIPDSNLMSAIRLKHPVVMCSQHSEDDDVPCVVIDDYDATRKAISYLLSIGKKRLAMINSMLYNSYAQYRETAFIDTLQAAGLASRPEWALHINDIDYNLAFSVAIKLLSGAERPDAVFCISDIFASAVLKAAAQLGLAVPNDVAVMGFDNVDLCNMTVPTLSTVNQPMYQLGWQSCNLLLDQIEGLPNITSRIVLATDIVVRSST